ncbi:MAG: hypothetical protein CRN43_17845 [Candidatus Nephrothrix sp. EaCA]|nr:MAG: hypothetical protein CRN43_17845 [Candidatus Nephrothrix sp. EaCA]
MTQVLVFVKFFEGKKEGNINFALKTLPINFMLLPQKNPAQPRNPCPKDAALFQQALLKQG